MPVWFLHHIACLDTYDCYTWQLVGERSVLGSDDSSSSNISLDEAGRASLDGGVLDTKWSETPIRNGAAVLACATSTGRLAVYALAASAEANEQRSGEREAGQITPLSSSDGAECLLLSLDWSRGCLGEAKVTNGCVLLLDRPWNSSGAGSFEPSSSSEEVKSMKSK